MYTSCKYVVMDNDEMENIYLFPSRVIHKSVSKNMTGKLVSAGFVGINQDGQRFCAGESESLNIKSRPQLDTYLLNRLLP